MSLPDFVQKTLDYIDSNWKTANYSPKPTLIDGDEMRLYSGGRARDTDVVNTNIVTADSGPTGTNTAIGTGYKHKVRYGVGISIEGYHQDGGGQIADKDDFDSLKDEVRRTILVERSFPSNLSDITHLTIEQENDLSPESPVDANYFRYEFDVWFEGYEDLP